MNQQAKIDFTPLLGKWLNLDKQTTAIKQFDLHEVDGMYCIDVVAVVDGKAQTVGRHEVEMYLSHNSAKPHGFHTCFTYKGTETRIASNLNNGVYVVQSYRHDVSQPHQAGYFSKEYFYPAAKLNGDKE